MKFDVDDSSDDITLIVPDPTEDRTKKLLIS